jgi:hypothetical protein
MARPCLHRVNGAPLFAGIGQRPGVGDDIITAAPDKRIHMHGRPEPQLLVGSYLAAVRPKGVRLRFSETHGKSIGLQSEVREANWNDSAIGSRRVHLSRRITPTARR